MTIKEIINDERIDLAMQLGMLSETELNIIDFAFERIEDAVMKRITELMCAMREWYEDGFNRGDCGELIVKHGGDA